MGYAPPINYLAPITALLALPLTFAMSNDAYYFGVVPVLAQAGEAYGISAEAIARASLMGGPVHSASPLLVPVYLAYGLLGVDVADARRFVLICGRDRPRLDVGSYPHRTPRTATWKMISPSRISRRRRLPRRHPGQLVRD